jgi:hypothetical protein
MLVEKKSVGGGAREGKEPAREGSVRLAVNEVMLSFWLKMSEGRLHRESPTACE